MQSFRVISEKTAHVITMLVKLGLTQDEARSTLDALLILMDDKIEEAVDNKVEEAIDNHEQYNEHTERDM